MKGDLSQDIYWTRVAPVGNFQSHQCKLSVGVCLVPETWGCLWKYAVLPSFPQSSCILYRTTVSLVPKTWLGYLRSAAVLFISKTKKFPLCSLCLLGVVTCFCILLLSLSSSINVYSPPFFNHPCSNIHKQEVAAVV